MKRNLTIVCVVWLLFAAYSIGDLKRVTDGYSSLGRGSAKVPSLQATALTFDGANSQKISPVPRALAVINENGADDFVFSLEAKSPSGNWVDIADFNSGSDMTIPNGDAKELGLAIYPYSSIRLVVTSGTKTGIYVVGAE